MSVSIQAKCPVCGNKTHHKNKGKVPVCKCGAAKVWGKWVSKLRDENGVSQTKQFATYDLASRHGVEMMAKKNGGASIAKKDTSYLAAVERLLLWVDGRVAKGKMAATTAKAYEYRLRTHCTPYFKDFDIRDIDHDAMDVYVAKRCQDTYGIEDKPYSPAEVNREIAAIKKLMTVSINKKVIDRNPIEGYELLGEDNNRDWVLDNKQIARLLEECRTGGPEYLETIVILALNTGLRRDGVLGLRWEHIDGKFLARTVKGGKELRIPLGPVVMDALARWAKVLYRGAIPLKKTGLVFPSPKTGKQMLVSSNIGWDKACERAGLKGLHFHDLRHTAATHMITACRDIHLVAKVLGHSTTKMTERYAHILEEKMEEMMDGLQIGGQNVS